jgi:Acetyltransferase (GNAT) domain
MGVHIADPLSDKRWDELTTRHPRASVFHQRGWLEALARTYGYRPMVLSTTPAGEPLLNGIVFCHVDSWLTGTRMVSLPFADHCEPLLNESDDCLELIRWLCTECDRQRWKYVELRPLSSGQYPSDDLQPSRAYCFHELDLSPSVEEIFKGLHKDSIQRKIRRAEAEKIEYEAGRSKQLVNEFYQLLMITRRRHKLIPQPRTWFTNLVECVRQNDLQIRVARRVGKAIAAMLTLRHGSTVVYKYGCSDEKFHSLGAMPFLFWKLIEESKHSGAHCIDFGRSDIDNEGLIAFKEKFGTTRRMLTYYRYPASETVDTLARWDVPPVRKMFSVLPDTVLSAAGRLLYRHMA